MADSEMVEISRTDLAVLQKAKQIFDDLWVDPKHAKAIQTMVAEKVPGARTPAALAEPFVAPIREDLTAVRDENKKLTERIDNWEKSQKDKAEETTLRQEIDSAQKKYRLTDEGVAAMIKRMRDKNNPDVESAATWVVSQQPKPAAVPTSSYLPQSMNLFGSSEKDEKWEELNRDPVKWADKEIATILNEFANGDQQAA